MGSKKSKNRTLASFQYLNILKSHLEFSHYQTDKLNIWEYIQQEKLKIVNLYFSKKRKVVLRNDQLFLLDDERFKLEKDDKLTYKNVRFRTLGCYPLTAGIESTAKNVSEIIKEVKNSNFSERYGRVIDYDKVGVWK